MVPWGCCPLCSVHACLFVVVSNEEHFDANTSPYANLSINGWLNNSALLKIGSTAMCQCWDNHLIY